MEQLLAPLIPAVAAVLLALAAYIRASAAHAKVDEHVEYTHRVAVPFVRNSPPAPDDAKE